MMSRGTWVIRPLPPWRRPPPLDAIGCAALHCSLVIRTNMPDMTSGAHRRPRRIWWIIGACMLLAAIGVGLFALAFRSCRFAIDPGQSAAWALTIRAAPLLADGKPGAERSAEHRVVLLGLGPESSAAAWLVGPAGAAPASLQLIDLPSDGRVRARGRDGRPGEIGPQLSGFDFNLLPLPMGAEQEWKPEVVWAALPEGRRAVACTVKRLRSGARPEFRCEFPVSVEWVDPATGRYRQVRELVSTYRFDTLRGVPREAHITFIMREEQPPPGGFIARRMTFDLAWLGREGAGDPRDLRNAAAAAVVAEGWVNARRTPARRGARPAALGRRTTARTGRRSARPPREPAMRWLAGLLLCAALTGVERQIVADPRLAVEWIPDRTSQESWRALFDPAPLWPERDVASLALNHTQRLPTLWAARLLYRGEPWTRRANEPTSDRRWRAADRSIKLAILRDLRWRRDAVFVPVLAAFLAIEDSEPALAVSALADLWLSAPTEGRAFALRIADPRRSDRLPCAGLPGVRTFALNVLLEDSETGTGVTPALEWALLTADGSERLAALAHLPVGQVPELVAGCLARLAAQVREGRIDDDGTAAAVLACARLGEAVGEGAARILAELAASAPRELACASAGALARSVTWKNAIDPAPLATRLAREADPAVRHALFAVLLRLAPARVTPIPGAGVWAELARHREALQDWAWRRF